MRKFKDKVVWLTGASSGIGKEMAKQLNALGATVILSSRRQEQLESIQNELTHPENSMVMPLDLANLAEVDLIVQKIISKYKRIDILFNNGGISQRSNASDTNLEVDRKIMEINYFGSITLTKAVLPFMRRAGEGHIVVVSSLSGKFGFFLRTAYSASKHALHGFFESLRLEEYENNIKITMLCPGPVKTNISVNAMDGEGKANNKNDKMQQEGMPVEDCVKRMISAIQKEKKEVLIGQGMENMSMKVKAIFPGLFFKLLLKRNPN